MFQVRWRWNVTRALAVLRQQGGKKVPPFLQKFRSEDLLAAAFPETVGCLENHHGDVEIPDHPLVQQTMHDCLHEAMDLTRWLELLDDVKAGPRRAGPVDTREPSPFSHQLLNANPYAFLDDAPLEERRTRAVTTRRSLAIEEVQGPGQARSRGDRPGRRRSLAAGPRRRRAARRPDELRRAAGGGRPRVERASSTSSAAPGGPRSSTLADGARFWIAAERWPLVQAVYPGRAASSRRSSCRPALTSKEWSAADGRVEIVRGQIQCRGPHTAEELAAKLHLEPSQVFAALESLEGSGIAMRGQFRSQQAGQEPAVSGQSPESVEWCERRLWPAFIG